MRTSRHETAHAFRYLGGRLAFVWERDAVGVRPVLTFVDADRALRFVDALRGEPPGMMLLRAVVEAGRHFDPLSMSDDAIVEALAAALVDRRLVIVEAPDFRGGGRSPAPLPSPRPAPGPPEPPRAELSYYEIRVIDELDKPLVGLTLFVTTPSGARSQKTDATGRVRLDREPKGVGSARVTSAGELSIILMGAAQRPRRRAPLPAGDGWHIATPARLDRAIDLPDAEPQTLMIVTRADFSHYAVEHLTGWYRFECAEPGPWCLADDPHLRLSVHSEGLGKRVKVLAVSADRERSPAYRAFGLSAASTVPPEAEPFVFLDLAVDDFVDALVRSDHDQLAAMLGTILQRPPFFPAVR